MEKQIEKLAKVIDEYTEPLSARDIHQADFSERFAKHLTEKGYREQTEGHWFVLEYEYFTCSECGDYYPNGCDSTKEAKEKLADGRYPNFCPNCGAKMKGAENAKAD